MDIKITHGFLNGEINAITSKSAAHRLLICAAFSDKKTELIIGNLSEDIEATINCLTELGAEINNQGRLFEVKPVNISEIKENAVINCGESGSTLRFILPLAAAADKNITVTGVGTLYKRPMKELIDVLELNGTKFSSENMPYTVSGGLKNNVYELPGDVSSGFISGLMFALPLLSGNSYIQLSSPLQSSGYVDMTVNILRLFGIGIVKEDNGWSIQGNQSYVSPYFAETEKDWSNAAFFLAAGALGGKVNVKGLSLYSAQGDKRIVQLLSGFGAEIDIADGFSITGNKLQGQEIDVSEIPDLLPVLAVLGALSEGKTVLYNAARLRLKESDRLASVSAMLNAFGFHTEEEIDRLTIHGGKRREITEVIIDSRSDHRITMSAAVLASVLNGVVTIIKNAEAANKSYPAFFEDFKKLGGRCHAI